MYQRSRRWWRNTDKSSAEFTRRLQSHGSCPQRGRSRFPLVSRKPTGVQQSSCPALSEHSIHNRCLKPGWGAMHQASTTGGMWNQDKNSPHKLPRDESSPTSLADFGFKEAEYPHAVAAWQFISHCVQKPQEGNSFQYAVRVGDRDLLCLACGVTIYAEHILGVYNTMVDAEFRQSFKLSDWKLHKEVFSQLKKVWGLYDVDLQYGTTDNSLIISASDPTHKHRRWMLWLSIGQTWDLMFSFHLLC